jgi:hypothetical protein
MSGMALSNKQFNTEQSILHQGNANELAVRVRGIQNMTSNIYKPSFAEDYQTVHSLPSGTQFKAMPHTGAGAEEEEDEE